MNPGFRTTEIGGLRAAVRLAPEAFGQPRVRSDAYVRNNPGYRQPGVASQQGTIENMHNRLVPLLLVLSVVGAACADGSTGEGPTTTVPDTTTTTPATTTTTRPVESPVIDWDDRDMTVTLPDGWTLAHCEGDAPLLCVARDGEVVGVLERFIADPFTFDAYDPAADDETNLRNIAASFVEAFQMDRASGCGTDYVLDPVEPAVVDLGGNPGLVYGFRGSFADGSPSEYHLQYGTISHGRLLLLAAAGYDEGGCPGKDDTVSFDTATLEALRPHLEDVLAASPLPGGDPETGLSLPDGYNFVWILAADGALVIDPARVLSGEVARLQAIADGVIPAGEDLPNDVYIHNPTEERIRLRLAEDVKWTVIAPGADGALAARDADQETIASIFAGGDPADIYGLTPEFMPFDVLVINGEVVEVNERYLP